MENSHLPFWIAERIEICEKLCQPICRLWRGLFLTVALRPPCLLSNILLAYGV